MLTPEEESDSDVRREDQDNINRFARLNARLHDVRRERATNKKSLEHLDDASTELMMGSGDKVLLLLGEAFFETTEADATEFCESRVDEMQSRLDELKLEQDDILAKQADLKKILYGRFGTSIHLEDSDDTAQEG